jgi:hypothetical protein
MKRIICLLLVIITAILLKELINIQENFNFTVKLPESESDSDSDSESTTAGGRHRGGRHGHRGETPTGEGGTTAGGSSSSDPPKMTIESTTEGVTNGGSTTTSPIVLQFTSNLSTSDFDQDDIGVHNGSLSVFTPVSETVYTATLTPNAHGEVIVNVNENTFTSNGINNIASTPFTFTYNEGFSNFMDNVEQNLTDIMGSSQNEILGYSTQNCHRYL